MRYHTRDRDIPRPGEIVTYADVRQTLEQAVLDYRSKREELAQRRNRDHSQLARLHRIELIGQYLRQCLDGKEGPVGKHVSLDNSVEEVVEYLDRFGVSRLSSTVRQDAAAIMQRARVRVRFRDQDGAAGKTNAYAAEA